MAKLQVTIDTIEAITEYVAGSLIIKSSDENGCVLKWLEDNGTTADRKEKFVQTDIADKNKPVTRREVLGEIMVNNPV